MRDTIDMAREVESEMGFKWCVNFIELERFESLVRADEREACAKICEREYDTGLLMAPESPSLAAAIRARGNT